MTADALIGLKFWCGFTDGPDNLAHDPGFAMPSGFCLASDPSSSTLHNWHGWSNRLLFSPRDRFVSSDTFTSLAALTLAQRPL